jgi:hypothetical protein
VIRVRRIAAGACFAAAALLTAAAFLGPAPRARADADLTIGRPTAYVGIAAASGLFQNTDRNNGISATIEPFYASIPDGLSVFSSDTDTARASAYYPGATVAGLGALLCTAGAPCGLPSYPLIATADQSHPDAAVDPLGGLQAPGAFSTGVVQAVVHAGVDYVSTKATISDLQLGQMTGSAVAATRAFRASTGASPSSTSGTALLHIGSLESTTRQDFTHTATLVVHAESQLRGVDIAGLIHIDSIDASSMYTTDGKSVHSHVDHLSVLGASAAGVPVEIGSDGVTVAGSGSGGSALDALNSALQSALSSSGLGLHVIGVTHEPGALQPSRCSAGEADGVALHAQADLNSVPVEGDVYHTDILLGGACTDATASANRVAGSEENNLLSGGLSAENGLPAAAGPAAPASASSSLSSPSATPAPSATAPGFALGSSPNAIPSAGLASPGSRSAGLAGFEGDLRSHFVTHRVSLLYLAFTLAFLGVVLGSRPLFRRRRRVV